MIKESDQRCINPSVFLLPNKGTDLRRWSVVACDQYTSQPDYWKKVEDFVRNNESALHLIYPEVYLEEDEKSKKERIEKINDTMRRYVEQGVLAATDPCFILTDRKTSHIASRKGLVVAVDLEKYDYTEGSQSLIRPTEGTILERIPPRLAIRKNACIELSHVMLLIDDPQKTVIEPLFQKVKSEELIYDFELMMDGGHLKGYRIDDARLIQETLSAIENLSAPKTFYSKYNAGRDKGVLLIAVGDGNHSLATAKAHWENVKEELSEEEKENHPARFAMAELLNVHSDGILFEPIHRVVFHIDYKEFLDDFTSFYKEKGIKAYYEFMSLQDDYREKIAENRSDNRHIIPFVTSETRGILAVEGPSHNLEVGTLQIFIDTYLKEKSQARADYIHGKETVEELAQKRGNIGFYLPALDKNSLFKSIIHEGVLPKKSFSMGESQEKRFYLECRKIVKDSFHV